MRINNNVMALNAHRQYGINNAQISKSTEKLSSGYRINRAGDDAAGLAISEKMRAQIRGLTMASKNSQDAISMVQTAEGALQESHNILQRMRELAVQSASDTNEQTIDRGALQQEFSQLQQELNDISTTTRFNDQNLLDGTFQSMRSTVSTTNTNLNNANSLSVARAGAGTYTMKATTTKANESETVPNSGAQATIGKYDTTNMAAMADKVNSVKFEGLETSKHNGNTYTLQVEGSDITKMTFTLIDSNGKAVSTAQNVDTSSWNKATTENPNAMAGNKVSFEGVGTFTFDIEETVTNVTDLTTMSGAKISFNSDGPGYKHTIEIQGSASLTALATEIATAALDAGPNLTATYTGPASGKIELETQSMTPPTMTFDYEIDKNGFMTASMKMDGTVVAQSNKVWLDGMTAGAGNGVTLDFGSDYGKIELTTSATTSVKKEYTNTIDLTTLDLNGSDLTNDLQTELQKLGDGSGRVTITHTAKPGATSYEYTSDAAITAANSLKFAISDIGINGTGGSITLTDGAGTQIGVYTIPNMVSQPVGAPLSIDMGDFGTLTLDVTAAFPDATGAGDPAAVSSKSVGASSDSSFSYTTAGNATETKKSYAFSDNTKLGASLIDTSKGINGYSTTETVIKGGKEQETTVATRAYQTLTINGESVNLYKGDTYANFAGQGISFEFNELSDVDIANENYFGKAGATNSAEITVNANRGTSLIIQTGANQGDELSINIDRISTETLGIHYSNISTQDSASQAIKEVNSAINTVSTQRAALGALQNRLNHKIANLDTSAENLTAAESRIRDVDMAKEMTTFTKNNILFQASTAMLAQANAAPQGVLQLLG